jgi:hypothetical protein
MELSSVKCAQAHTLVWFVAVILMGWGFYDTWHQSLAPECDARPYQMLASVDSSALLIANALTGNVSKGSVNASTIEAYSADVRSKAMEDFIKTRPSDCFGAIYNVNFVCLGISILSFIAAVADYNTGGKRLALNVGGTLNFRTFPGLRNVFTSFEYPAKNIRFPAEIALFVYSTGMFILWVLAADSQSLSGARIAYELPLLRGGLLVWFVVVPTACTLYQEHILAKEKNVAALRANLFFMDQTYTMWSLLLKLLLAIVSFAVVDPTTQLLFEHAKDNSSQRTVTIMALVLTFLLLAVFWYMYYQESEKRHATRNASGQTRTIDMPFAYNDFCVHLTLVFAIMWGYTGRARDAHTDDTTIFDFVLQMIYLVFSFLAVSSLPSSAAFSIDADGDPTPLVQIPIKDRDEEF